MLDLQFATSVFFCSVSFLLCFLLIDFFTFIFQRFFTTNSPLFPPSYPLIGSLFAIAANKERRPQWTSDALLNSPNLTFILHYPLGRRQIFTANVSNVQHILKTKVDIYQKGDFIRSTLSDFLGQGIFNADGNNWKVQRQLSVLEFNTKSLKNFVENVVDTELSKRLIPILESAAANKTILDLQDILQRFAFDTICIIAFGHDPAYLSPSLPQSELAVAFETATQITGGRFSASNPLVWKIKRALNIGSEKELKGAINQIREFGKQIIKEKKIQLQHNSSLDSVDLLSRFLSSGHSVDFITDIVVSFIFAGRDSTSEALTWFFWLINKNPDVENTILTEIKEKSESPVYEEVKDMIYTHASLCESMRLYPPIPMDSKTPAQDDVLPDGTVVRKGTDVVTYHPYAMGRVKKVWGPDFAKFRPERWLERDRVTGNWNFLARDPYTYPVFQAGPRICLGKDMAFLQMKRVVAGILRRFRVVSALEDGVEPIFIAGLSSKMKDGFPVRIVERDST